MPRPSKIEPVLIRPEEWLKRSSPPLGSQEGHHFGVDCVVIRYSTDDFVELSRERKTIAFDFVESVFGLDEDRFGGFTAECRLADAFDAVEQDTGRLRLPAGLDGFE